MATLAPKLQHPATVVAGNPASLATSQYASNVSSNRQTPASAVSNHGFFASPTESEFSESYEVPESIKGWNEERVGEWLRSIGCAQYIELFRSEYI
jgi:mitogen-activated protein kinase kinase kinase